MKRKPSKSGFTKRVAADTMLLSQAAGEISFSRRNVCTRPVLSP
jgi:hypothetical protein